MFQAGAFQPCFQQPAVVAVASGPVPAGRGSYRRLVPRYIYEELEDVVSEAVEADVEALQASRHGELAQARAKVIQRIKPAARAANLPYARWPVTTETVLLAPDNYRELLEAAFRARLAAIEADDEEILLLAI